MAACRNQVDHKAAVAAELLDRAAGSVASMTVPWPGADWTFSRGGAKY
jgi:hypothetical protein